MGTDTNDELVNACLIGFESGLYGYVHQCEGLFGITIEDSVGLRLEEVGFFGGEADGDSYSNPKVMACCDVYDPNVAQPHQTACYKDLVEGICLSAPAKMAAAFNGITGVGNLVDHVASTAGQEDCKAVFNTEIDNWSDPSNPEDPLDLTWSIGNNIQWALIEDPSLHIDAQVTDVLIPESSAEYLECHDNDFNNGQSLIGIGENPEYSLFLHEGDGVLIGPRYNFPNPMGGNLEFESDDLSCRAPLCSRIHFSENATDWTLHNLAYYSNASATIGDQTLSYTVDWFHIELVGPVQATEVATNHFQVAQGDALFLLGGEVEGTPHHLTVTNASTITVWKERGVWKTSSFALQYLDSSRDTWTLAIAAADWVDPT